MANSYLEQQLTDPSVRLAFEQDWFHQEFVVQMEQCMEKLGLLQKHLAERMGKTPAFISKALSDGHNLTSNTMVQMAFAAGYRINLQFTPYSENKMPESSFTNTNNSSWSTQETGVIISMPSANDNRRARSGWDDNDNNEAALLAAA